MRFALETNKITEKQETSAHPGSPNFDQAYANQVMGDIAEQLREILASDFNCRPPGLRTEAQQGGLRVVADNPEVGIGMSIQISLLPVSPPQTLPQAPGGLPASGPATAPGPAAGPPGPVSQAQFGPPSASTPPGAATASRQAYAPIPGKALPNLALSKGRKTRDLLPRKEMQDFYCAPGAEGKILAYLRNRGFEAQGQEGSGSVSVLIDREDEETEQNQVYAAIRRFTRTASRIEVSLDKILDSIEPMLASVLRDDLLEVGVHPRYIEAQLEDWWGPSGEAKALYGYLFNLVQKVEAGILEVWEDPKINSRYLNGT